MLHSKAGKFTDRRFSKGDISFTRDPRPVAKPPVMDSVKSERVALPVQYEAFKQAVDSDSSRPHKSLRSSFYDDDETGEGSTRQHTVEYAAGERVQSLDEMFDEAMAVEENVVLTKSRGPKLAAPAVSEAATNSTMTVNATGAVLSGPMARPNRKGDDASHFPAQQPSGTRRRRYEELCSDHWVREQSICAGDFDANPSIALSSGDTTEPLPGGDSTEMDMEDEIQAATSGPHVEQVVSRLAQAVSAFSLTVQDSDLQARTWHRELAVSQREFGRMETATIVDYVRSQIFTQDATDSLLPRILFALSRLLPLELCATSYTATKGSKHSFTPYSPLVDEIIRFLETQVHESTATSLSMEQRFQYLLLLHVYAVATRVFSPAYFASLASLYEGCVNESSMELADYFQALVCEMCSVLPSSCLPSIAKQYFNDNKLAKAILKSCATESHASSHDIRFSSVPVELYMREPRLTLIQKSQPKSEQANSKESMDKLRRVHKREKNLLRMEMRAEAGAIRGSASINRRAISGRNRASMAHQSRILQENRDNIRLMSTSSASVKRPGKFNKSKGKRRS